jgi:outer membrane protein
MKVFYMRLVYGLVFLTAPLLLSAQQKDTLSLEEVIRVGLNNNYSIHIARMESEIAANNVTRGNAGFLPVVNVTAAKNFNNIVSFEGDRLVSDSIITVVIKNASSDNFNISVGLTWTIFDGMKMFTTYERLGALRRLGEVNARAQMENAVAQIVLVYFSLLVEQERLQVLQKNIEISEERIKIAKSKYEVGSGSKLEYLTSQVDYNADRTGLIRQQELVNVTRTMLNQLILFDLTEEYAVSPTISFVQDLVLEDLIGSLKTSNAAIVAARQNIYVANLAIRELQADRLPFVSLNVGTSYSTSNNPTGFFIRNENESLNYGIAASWNIFNGFNLTRNIQNAKIMADISTARTKELEVNQEGELRVAYTRYINNLALLEMETENVKIAMETAAIALDRYKLGVSTPLELREAQRTTTTALIRKLDVEYAAKLAELELYRLSGNLLDKLN